MKTARYRPAGQGPSGVSRVRGSALSVKVTSDVSSETGHSQGSRRLNLKDVKEAPGVSDESVGMELRAMRLQRGETIAQVSQVLRIRKDLVEAIEHSRHDLLPGQAYAVGFVRSYADYLRLDTADVVRRYKAEMAALDKLCKAEGVECVVADNWGSGGAGAADLAKAVVKTIETQPSNFKPLYPDDMPLADKVRTIAKELYGAADISYDSSIKARFAELEKEGFGKFPVCIAKTQYSFSTDQNAKGAPSGFTIPIRELRLSAGAEFIVAVCGDIMTMPGLPKVPAANNIYVDESGRIAGLF